MTNRKSKSTPKKAAKAATFNGVHQNPIQDGPVVIPDIDVDGDVNPVVSSPTSDPNDAPSTSPSPTPAPKSPLVEAEEVKEHGNTVFKVGRYGEAIDLYTQAIQLNPSEPSYLTNRAASYMAIKKFRPALEDCQQAFNLSQLQPQKTDTIPKTLLRLARCQLALGSTTAALSTVRTILGYLDSMPSSTSTSSIRTQALSLQTKAHSLESHIHTFYSGKRDKNWALARLALDRCLQAVEAEGGEIPVEWRIGRIEVDIGRRDWDGATVAASDALRLNSTSTETLHVRGLLLFLIGKLGQSTQHLASALRYDPSHEPSRKLRIRVKDVERLKEEGNAAFKANKWDGALERYGEALERIGAADEEGGGGHIRATILSNRATTLVKLDRHEEALTDIESSLTLHPTSFKALRTRARIHLHLSNYDQSIASYNSALEHAQHSLSSSSPQDGGASEADVRGLRVELKKAEAALKRSKTKDYYKILGISKECRDQAEIKKAYRRESLVHHPDKGGDEEKFKLVTEAYAVLSDARRRERYDLGEDEDGSSASPGGGGPGFGFGPGMGMSHADLADIFAQFGGAGGGGGGGGGGGFPGGAGRSYGFSF